MAEHETQKRTDGRVDALFNNAMNVTLEQRGQFWWTIYPDGTRVIATQSEINLWLQIQALRGPEIRLSVENRATEQFQKLQGMLERQTVGNLIVGGDEGPPEPSRQVLPGKGNIF